MGREGVHGVVRGNRAAGSRGALETQCREAGVMNALWRPRACAVGARHSAPADFGQWRAHGHTAQRALANAMSPIGTNPSAGRGGLSSWLASIESGVDAALRPVLGEVPARAKSAAWPCPAWSRPAPGTLRSVLALVAWVWVQQAYNMPTGPLALTGSTRHSLRMAADRQYGDGFGTAGSGPVAGAAAGSDPHQRAAAGRAARPRGRKRQRRCATQMAGGGRRRAVLRFARRLRRARRAGDCQSVRGHAWPLRQGRQRPGELPDRRCGGRRPARWWSISHRSAAKTRRGTAAPCWRALPCPGLRRHVRVRKRCHPAPQPGAPTAHGRRSACRRVRAPTLRRERC